jgi:hypothetical protein
MQSTDLTREQLTAILAAVQPSLDYLNKLRRRMQHRSFPLEDPLVVSVTESQRTILSLMATLRECRSQSRPAPANTNPNNHLGYRLGRPRHETH